MSQNQSGRRMPTPATAAAPATSDAAPAAQPATAAAHVADSAAASAEAAAASTSLAAHTATIAASSAASAAALAASAMTSSQWAATSAQQATSGLSQVLSLEHASFDPDELVEMRVLVDHGGHACNAVIVLPAGEARAAEDARWGDTHPAAIAAARA
ncbi:MULTISPECIES: hypothetical protein [Sphingomonas]|uniref:Uncharacterized protein n=1 Tax=Sphingomonas molluscorum TaxID=418184 RepID=A0ABU8Q7P5_9SPHN|nr:hypothetical protein [Sphingomonas sp. JUb134]MBM7407061.1 type IV secretory pathway TrbL component [Sphingomonas sp. JUb134]